MIDQLQPSYSHRSQLDSHLSTDGTDTTNRHFTVCQIIRWYNVLWMNFDIGRDKFKTPNFIKLAEKLKSCQFKMNLVKLLTSKELHYAL